jgi:hypothetical protein
VTLKRVSAALGSPRTSGETDGNEADGKKRKTRGNRCKMKKTAAAQQNCEQKRLVNVHQGTMMCCTSLKACGKGSHSVGRTFTPTCISVGGRGSSVCADKNAVCDVSVECGNCDVIPGSSCCDVCQISARKTNDSELKGVLASSYTGNVFNLNNVDADKLTNVPGAVPSSVVTKVCDVKSRGTNAKCDRTMRGIEYLGLSGCHLVTDTGLR